MRATNLAGLHEVYSKTTYFKFQAHVTYETLKSSKETLILDASSKTGSDAQPSSANVTQCSLTGWGWEGGHMWPPPFSEECSIRNKQNTNSMHIYPST